jgi:hypothetical protein
MRGLARERGQRFQNMADLVAALCGDVRAPADIHTATTAVLPSGSSPPEPDPDRVASASGRTTFSRSSGEVGTKSSDDLLPIRDPSRRWVALGIAGAAVLGAVLFFGLRSDERPASTEPTRTQSTTKTAIEDTVPTAAVAPTVTEETTPAAQKPDAGVVPQTAHAGGAAKRQVPATARKTVSLPTTKKGSSEEEWIAH